jgi:filamentous hemagglutinin family protein
MSKSLSAQVWLFIFGIFGVLSIPKPITAQVVPDNTLSNDSQVTTEGNTDIIEGGTSSGNNLFHSFDSFSVSTGGTAYFNNAQAIQNIFSRVTGSSISNIDGLIKANDSANLFLLNPNGILFGSNASLNLGGSFFATSASSIKFADGVEFSATNPQVNPALTVSVPVGLGFASNPGAITVQGEGNNLSYDPQTFEAVRDDRPAGLQVNKGKTLALVGGDINIEGGNLTAEEGRIELGSVGGNETVNLALDSSGWKLGYENVKNFQDIQLSGAASVDTSGNGAGDIQVQGRQIRLSNGSAILANTLGNANGGNITVKASEQIQTSGISANNSTPSGIYADSASGATGKGGNLTINTGRLEITDGSQIGSGTFGAGDAGELNVTAQDVEVVGAGASAPSALFVSAQSGSTGKGGNLTINTDRLKLADGAQISSGTFGAGDAGELKITAQDVEVVGQGALATSGLFVSAQSGSTGKGGNLTIESDRVRVTGGAQISSRSLGSGQAGNIDISANQIESDQGSITAASDQSGGGDINLKTEQLFLSNNSSINTSVFNGTGGGGNLAIDTDTLVALDNSDFTANAIQGAGGNIAISAKGFFRSLDSDIDASSELGIDGEVNIKSAITDFQNVLNPISPEFIVAEEALQGSCFARRNSRQGSFVYGGAGGLPVSPSSAIDEESSLSSQLPEVQPNSQTSGSSDLGSEDGFAAAETVVYPAQTAQKWKVGEPIIEPTNLIKTADGRLLWVRKQVDDASSLICQ